MTRQTDLRWAGWLAALAMACNTFVTIVVNYNIYWARAAHIERHPEAFARQPPTISGALEDPLIGGPFSFWVTLSAVLLFVGVTVLMLAILRALPREARRLRAIAMAVIPFQVVTSVGMVMLSQFRFPDHTELHMLGSYLAFIAETIVVLLWLWLSLAIGRQPEAERALQSARIHHPAANRLRPILAGLCLGSGVVFAILFVAKDYIHGPWRYEVFQVYVSAEPAFITFSLLTLLAYNADLALRLQRRPRRIATGAASPR